MDKIPVELLLKAHKHSSDHRDELEVSASCGCFYCCNVIKFQDIVEWVDRDSTALCPKCGIDSVIGSGSGFQITQQFLDQMRDHWFWEVENGPSPIMGRADPAGDPEED